MGDTENPDRSTTEPTKPWSGAEDIIQSALLEASRIRLEALQSGERMYEDLVKAAQSRCKQMVADARQEANRIISEAESQAASIQAGRDHESRQSEAALEQLRSEMAAMLRTLRQGLDEDHRPGEVGNASGAAVPIPEVLPSLRQTATLGGSFVPRQGHELPSYLSEQAQADPRSFLLARDRSERTGDRVWIPPDWMRDET